MYNRIESATIFDLGGALARLISSPETFHYTLVTSQRGYKYAKYLIACYLDGQLKGGL